MKCKSMRLSAVAFGVSLGLMSGIAMMLVTWASWHWGVATNAVQQWGSVYPGLTASLQGGFVGLAWGFLEGFIIGIIWAWLYNLCLCSIRCCCKKSEEECKKE